MTSSRVLTLASGLLAAGLVGSAIAAVPDPSPFTWSTSLPVSAEIVLPDVPPPPGRHATRLPPRADIVLATQPHGSAAPCAAKRSSPSATGTTSARSPARSPARSIHG